MNKLLIVEDSVTVRSILAEVIIKNAIFAPYFAETFFDAKELIEENVFTCAILDLELPDAASGEVVEYCIKKNIPSIVLTGTFNKDLRSKILKLPIVDYIIKHSIEDIHTAVYIAENILMFKDKKALVVDDSATARMVIKQHFDNLLFNVIEADSAQKALELIASNPDISVITVDYEMPNTNGVQLIQKIRHKFTHLSFAIYGVCGSNSELIKAQFLKSGANDYFTKPLLKEEFNVKVGSLLRILEQQKKLFITEQILSEYKKALNEGSIISKSDLNGIITDVNDAFLEITGYTKEEIIGKPHNILRDHSVPKTIFIDMWETIRNQKTWKGILKNVKKNGDTFYTKTTIVPIVTNNEIIEFIAFRENITKLIENEEDLKTLFLTDPLTKMGNRQKLLKDISNTKNPALTLIDISRFKEINGFYGNNIGDEILIKVSDLIIKYFYTKTNNLYRLYSDVFAILTSISQENEESYKTYISKKLELIQKPISISNKSEIFVSYAAGLCFNAKDLIQADMALKKAKTKEQSFFIYDRAEEMEKEYEKNILWTKIIKNAIEDDRVVPFFQPIYDNKSNKITKYECLARIISEDGEIYSPYLFLDIAKKTKLYPKITKIMLSKSMEYFANKNFDFSINLTIDDILDPYTSNLIFQLLMSYKISKKAIFEIVESQEIQNYKEVVEFIKKLKNIKARVAIDDFGTGYSNFDYFLKLDIDFIKIDGSLIKNIHTDKTAKLVVESIASLSTKKGFKTVAEFVSQEEIQEIVKTLQIDYSQGYYFGQPQKDIL